MSWLPLVLLLVLCSPIVALAPVRWAIRLWTIIALLFATTVTFRGEIQFEDEWILPNQLIFSVLIAILCIPLVIIGLRQAHSDIYPRPASRRVTPSAGERRVLHWMDLFIASLGGLCVGLFLTLALAVALRGFPGGLTLHIAVAAIAAVAAVVPLRYFEGLPRAAVTSALLLVAGLTLAGGFLYPQLIANKAAAIDPTSPRCLRAVDRPVGPDETRLLTLPHGQPGGPGLILTVMAPRGIQHYRWSYRSMSFTKYGAYRYGGCPA